MLGKQGWKLRTSENSLVGRVFKARYFPKGNFLDAEIGHNPSYVWRSVLASKDLIRKGTRWRVGDGMSIRILDQPWLPNDQDPV